MNSPRCVFTSLMIVSRLSSCEDGRSVYELLGRDETAVGAGVRGSTELDVEPRVALGTEFIWWLCCDAVEGERAGLELVGTCIVAMSMLARCWREREIERLRPGSDKAEAPDNREAQARTDGRIAHEQREHTHD